MNKRSNDQTLKAAIDELLKTFHLDEKMQEVKLVNSWEKIMGKAVSNRTTQIFIRDKKLFVYLNSASLRQELHNEKEKITRLLNDEVGTAVIREIIFQ